MKKHQYKISAGAPYPLGATPSSKGVNFSVFSKNATKIQLLLFDKHDASAPFQTISLEHLSGHHTYHFWHVFVEKLPAGFFYAYRVDGPYDLSLAHRFNPNKVLIDPYSKGIDYSLWNVKEAQNESDNIKSSLRSAIIDSANYDWEGDTPLCLPLQETIVYELHVGNFTKSPTSGVKHPGKFHGLIEKIPYLKSLGITAVELMPVMDFKTGNDRNVWGYGTGAFFAPEGSYCLHPSQASHVSDFRHLVKELHRANIEVILDVVFGYSTEGDQSGPVFCFKGFDNSIYYHLSPEDKQYYMNFSGCGNTLNANHPVVSKFILDCLEYWVEEMHVDGFRFDEASLLSRDKSGELASCPNVLWNIDFSEKLHSTKIFAEPWDAGGAYLVGQFPGYRSVEWNGKYRDDMRRFVRGDMGLVPTIAGRLTGSADLYQATNRLPLNSLNFITAHDGFCLNDLVSYNQKHNEENGENNVDGLNDNYAWNCGSEGETDDKSIIRFRHKQIKNFFTMLFLSKGIPMITMGDEIARTQKGNNNTYCIDSETVWFDWGLIEKNANLLEFFRGIIKFRKRHKFFYDNDVFSKADSNGWPEIAFHGCKLNEPGWDNEGSRVLSYTLNRGIHVVINMDDLNLDFEIPKFPGKHWYIAINTAHDQKGVFASDQELPVPDNKIIPVETKSIIVLVAK